MEPHKVAREQHIAVFGESGSGKTVLVSSFYGATQEPSFKQNSLFNVVAEDGAQGTRLHQNYLGMKNSASRPAATRFASSAYSFAIKRRQSQDLKPKKSKQPEDLRLVWHDYPGEWFEQEPSGPEEAKRRVDTFKLLLASDVAVILVDAQKLLDNAGEEERYLKALFTNFSNGLLKLQDDLLHDGEPLVQFPRVWLLALSKADLFQDEDVTSFRDLVLEKAGGEINELRTTLGGLMEAPEALSVGEDFVLLSSASFEPGTIKVSKRIGLDLVLPMAALLPFSRFVKWASAMHMGGQVAEELLKAVGGIAAMVTFGNKIPVLNKIVPAVIKRIPGPVGKVAWLVGIFGPNMIDKANDLGTEKLQEINREAKAKHDFLTAVLSDFQLALDRAEEQRVLLRSIQ
jgi:hypothetical protein